MTMPNLPYSALFNLNNGVTHEASQLTIRHLSDMASFFLDQQAAEILLNKDPILYRVYLVQEANSSSLWITGMCIIEPGCVGVEYFMTKGHYHTKKDAPEIYLTIRGKGMLLLQTRFGDFKSLDMSSSVMNYIPGGWAHRTVNIGDEPLVVFAVWPADAGYDYGTIAKQGFKKLVVRKDDGPRVIDNSKYIPENIK